MDQYIQLQAHGQHLALKIPKGSPVVGIFTITFLTARGKKARLDFLPAMPRSDNQIYLLEGIKLLEDALAEGTAKGEKGL